MEKNQANVEQIIFNIISLETGDNKVLTSEIVSEISEEYIRTGELVLPESILSEMGTYEDDPIPPGVGALRRALRQEFEQYTPTSKKVFEDAVETIIVKVAGLELETYIDGHGIQRFRTDTVIVNLFDQNMIDLDSLSRDFHNGKITTEDLLNFYAKSGYSVGGLSSLSHFSHLTFENPLWE